MKHIIRKYWFLILYSVVGLYMLPRYPEHWFEILYGAVTIFMMKRFPTGVGGDPFPYELGITDEDEKK